MSLLATACGGSTAPETPITSDASVADGALDTRATDIGDGAARCKTDLDCEGAYYLKICQEGICCNGTLEAGVCQCHGGRPCRRDEVCCPGATMCVVALGTDPCRAFK